MSKTKTIKIGESFDSLEEFQETLDRYNKIIENYSLRINLFIHLRLDKVFSIITFERH